MTNRPSASLADVFERALGEIQARVCISTPATAPSHNGNLALAYSGGLDSSVLLHLAQAYAERHGCRLHAFHVHHGLSPHADAWLAHCRDECERLGLAFDFRRINVIGQRQRGVEEAARLARYAALGDMCRSHGVPLLLTAHHQDDQAETILLQLLRGAGVAGLSGMDVVNTAPMLLGDADLLMARPLLAVRRAELAAYAKASHIAHVDDESNDDPRYARNALRHHVMPVLERYFPGAAGRIVRTAGHAQAAQRLMVEVAAQDLAACMKGDGIDLQCLQALSDERIDNVLRHWLAQHGARMPASAWLREMRAQLFSAKEDARVSIMHPDCCIRRHRGVAYLTTGRSAAERHVTTAHFRWNGESEIHFPAFQGTLLFRQEEGGIDAAFLRSQQLTLHLRSGGERLKPAPNRPTRSLKHHYQALGIPAWERERLPLVSLDGQLVFAAGIGMDSRHVKAGPGMRLHWQFDQA